MQVRSLYVDGEKLLVGTEEGLRVFNLETEQFYGTPVADLSADLIINSITATQQGYLAGTEQAGIFAVASDFGTFTKKQIKGFAAEAFTVQKILPEENGNIYIATDGFGLLYVDADFNLLREYTNDVNNPQSISGDGIYDLLIGNEDILWVSTYSGGLNKLKLSENYFSTVSHKINEPNSIAQNFTRSILQDAEGNMWYGTKRGISLYDAAADKWQHFSLPPGSSPVPVLSMKEDGNFVWAGTYGKGAFKIDKKTLATQRYSPESVPARRIALSHVYSVLPDRNGNVWLGGIRENLHKIAADGRISTYPVSQIRSIIESKNGGILIGGKNGVQRIVGENIEDYKGLKSGNNGLTYITISGIAEQKNGNIAVATNGSGLVIYNPRNKQIQKINISNGLPSDVVQGLLFDAEENLWVSTTRGLAQIIFTKGEPRIRVYDKGDGVSSSEFNYGSYVRLRDGRLAFGGTEGVTIFDPEEIKMQREIPQVVLEDFRLLTGENDTLVRDFNVKTTNEIELTYRENTLTIQFAGVLHSNPEKVRYSWRMLGLNDNWSQPTKQNNVNFTNLSPGDYTFQVKAANRDGVFSEPETLKINIAAPWYATPTAYFLYFLLLAALIAALVHFSNVLIKKRNADEQIAFFNNITHELKTPLTILLSDLESSDERGEDSNDRTNRKVKSTVKRLNILFDQLLNYNKVTSGHYQAADVTPIKLRAYIDRVVDNFQPLLDKKNISVRVVDYWNKEDFYYDKSALDKICFNLVSNAVKYSKDGGHLEITIADGGKEDLKISVADDGIGIPPDQQKSILKRFYRGRNAINSQLPGTGLGLMIVKNLIDRDKGSISFTSTEGEGTTFTVGLRSQEMLYSAVTAAEDTAPNIEAETPTESPNEKTAEFSDAKILIVEDNDELRHSLSDRLGMHFQVFEAADGREGLEKAGEIFPDLILTDMIMPEMDGMEMCRKLNEDINMNHIPVFMMTVLNSTQNKIESIESGIAAYMEKPLNFPFLLAKITNALAQQKKLRERYLHQTEVKTAAKYRNERDAEFIDDLEQFVLKTIQEEGLSVHDLCRHVGMSRTALYMKLKNMVDLSPQNFIIHTRLKFARQLLTEGGSNIKEVAYAVGFSNPKYFSTAFKKFFGESPTSFLKGLKGE